MAGYWPRSFLGSKNTQKKRERGQYTATLTEQAWSRMDLVWLSGSFSCGTLRVHGPERAR